MSVRPTLLAAAAALFATSAMAEITIEDPYFRTASPMAKSGAAFMILHNSGAEDDRLIAAASDAAMRIELHTHKDLGDGVMQMMEVEDGFVIPASGSHALARGGDHVMFMGLIGQPAQDETITVTLTFEQAGDITLDIPVDLTRQPEQGTMQGMSN